MKRFSCFFLFFFVIAAFLLLPGTALSQRTVGAMGIEPKIIVKGKIIEQPKTNLSVRCVSVMDGRDVPCSFQVTMDKVYTENCSGAAYTPCGHNDVYHIISRDDILKNNDAETFRILGGLTDAQQADMTTELPERQAQGKYSYTYHSGEISGKIRLKTFAVNAPGWRFLKPCEKENECTIFQDVNIEHCGGKYACQRFAELPQPLPPTGEYGDWADGYVRCGMSSKCTDIPDDIDPVTWMLYDRPYNWPAHPTVHWGRWEFNFELMMLANKWYKTFKKPLVINDISLPKGGLLDCKTPEKPDWNTPHKSHRKGIEADILKISVPEKIGRPERPDDERWLVLYRKYKLFHRLKLRCLEEKRDYNHLIYKGKIN